MQRIGVRDLRQQTRRYLKRVQAGEAFEVTNNGRPVARLVPLPTDPWQALIDSGQVIPAALPGGLLSIQAIDFGIHASAELAATRALEDRSGYCRRLAVVLSSDSCSRSNSTRTASASVSSGVCSANAAMTISVA